MRIFNQEKLNIHKWLSRQFADSECLKVDVSYMCEVRYFKSEDVKM